MLPITAVSAAALAFVHIWLSLRVIGYRRRLKVSVGDGGHTELERAIRCQANLAEYAPIALILLICLELTQAPMWLIGLTAACFVVGRVLHPLGLSKESGSFRLRVGGMLLTLWSIVALAVLNLGYYGYALISG